MRSIHHCPTAGIIKQQDTFLYGRQQATLEKDDLDSLPPQLFIILTAGGEKKVALFRERSSSQRPRRRRDRIRPTELNGNLSWKTPRGKMFGFLFILKNAALFPKGSITISTVVRPPPASSIRG